MRYNLYRCEQIGASAKPGYSSTQVMKALEEVFAETMPKEMGFDYLGMSFQEQQAQKGVSPAVVFSFAIFCVFLILAALYESWSLPFSVLLGTPIAVFGAFAGLTLAIMKQPVCPDWLGDADRPCREECHSDRRIRQNGVEEANPSLMRRWRRRVCACGQS